MAARRPAPPPPTISRSCSRTSDNTLLPLGHPSNADNLAAGHTHRWRWQMTPVSVDEAFSPREVDEMARAAASAEERCGLHFSVFVGQSDGRPEEFAQRLLAAIGNDAPKTVLIHIDPTARRLEIVTGTEAAQRIDDRACGLASLSMASSLDGGDVVGAVVTGLRVLGD